ncbi:hypothetical protein M422DRAFT_265744 [Sphaerobolus stellatus SS14]|uniref:Alcohol dehydrogenase-like N-terminal domain-containing protein n=1 Tax=Sphaerobolus stellatus (strain SS14) TaxID=990650 RepID=A0A0C9V4Q3_SPHS4|nr:hypothetical protein M422DRAFT_265744 [Sphaerobolus stellatus SS14]
MASTNTTGPVIPQTQRAWLVIKRGTPSKAVVLKKDFPVPKHAKLKKGEVIVKVHAGALNPVGWKVMLVLPNFLARRPHIAEHDLAGIIVDPNGSHFKAGDEVFGWIPLGISLFLLELRIYLIAPWITY